MQQTNLKTFQFSGFTTVDATNTSDSINIEGAKRVTLIFEEAGTVLNRSGVLTITGQLEKDGTYYAINCLVDNVSNAISEGLTRVASKTRNTVGVNILALPMEFGFKNIKATVTVTDGATPTGFFQVKAFVEY